MAAEDGRKATADFCKKIARTLGPPMKKGDVVSEEQWKVVFDLIRENGHPHGCYTALAEWANTSRWSIRERWESQDSSHHNRRGPLAILPPAMEDRLAEHIIMQAKVRNGLPIPVIQSALRRLSTAVSRRPRGGSYGHVKHFLLRHPDVVHRTGEATSEARAVGLTHVGHNRFHDNLDRAGINDTPPRKVVNFDESSVVDQTRKGIKVLGPRYAIMKRISTRMVGATQHVSILAGVRANGLPYGKLIFIMKAVDVPAEMASESEDYLIITTASGGMESHAWETCCKYWASIAEGGEIFIVDGHKSHADFLAVESLVDAFPPPTDLKMLTLDPNTTDLKQVHII